VPSIVIDPVNVDKELAERTARKISGILALPIIVEKRLSLSRVIEFYDEERGQVRADLLLDHLSELPAANQFYLALIDADAYVGGLNFIFGVAKPGWGGLLFLQRLRQGVYGEAAPETLFESRIIKETLHEIGHVLGLGHCRTPRCVMNFSNSLLEVDAKSAAYCAGCASRIIQYIRTR